MRRYCAVLIGMVLAGFPGTRAVPAEMVGAMEFSSQRGAFLARGMGARAAGMGDAFTAIADDPSGVSWNPAGAGQIKAPQAVAAGEYASHGLGITYVAGATPLGIGTVGAGLALCDYGEYEVRDYTGFKSGTDSIRDVAGGASYAMRVPMVPGGMAGVALEVVREGIGSTLGGLSFGGLLVWEDGTSLGLSVLHLGPRVGGYSMPTEARFGFAGLPLPELRLAVDTSYRMVDKDVRGMVGCEYTLLKVMVLRAGSRWLTRDEGLGSTVSLAAGAGFVVGGLGLDYAYQPFGELGMSHRIALRYRASQGAGIRGKE